LGCDWYVNCLSGLFFGADFCVDPLQETKIREYFLKKGALKMVTIGMQIVRIGNPILGIIIPALVFIFSFIVTWILYKHFSRNI
jgi:hypothetical protein